MSQSSGYTVYPTKATDAPQLDLDLLKLLEEATTKVRDPGTIKVVEAA